MMQAGSATVNMTISDELRGQCGPQFCIYRMDMALDDTTDMKQIVCDFQPAFSGQLRSALLLPGSLFQRGGGFYDGHAAVQAGAPGDQFLLFSGRPSAARAQPHLAQEVL